MNLRTTALLAAALAGCATTEPAWLSEPHAVVPIRWVRTQDPPQWEVRDGACVLRMPDTELGRASGDALVRRCLAVGGLVPGAGDIDVHWHEVDTLLQLWVRKDSAYPPTPAMPSLSLKPQAASRTMGHDATRITGFFSRPDPSGPCHVVSLRNSPMTLGHELKHCIDGLWHL